MVYAYSVLTVESDDCIEVIFVVLALSLPGQCLYGEWRVGGEGAEAGEKIDSQVGPSRLCLLRPWKTDG